MSSQLMLTVCLAVPLVILILAIIKAAWIIIFVEDERDEH